MNNFEGLQAHALVQSGHQIGQAMTQSARRTRGLLLGGLFVAAMAAAPHPASAGWVGEVVGAGAGAAVMSTVGKGDGRTAAMVVGGVVGKEVGGALTRDQPQAQSGMTNGPAGVSIDLGKTATKGVGAALGAAFGSMIGKGGGRTAAMVIGGIVGAEVADNVMYGNDGGQAQPGSYNSVPAGFRNGTVPLNANERSAMDKAADEAAGTFNDFRQARANVENMQYQFDFSTGGARNQIGYELNRANYAADNARRMFETTRGQFASLVADAASKYNRDVGEYANAAHYWTSVPTAGAVPVSALNQVAENAAKVRMTKKYGM